MPVEYTRRNQYKENPILSTSFELALEVIRYCQQLEKTGRNSISRQLLRSGTSIGANAKEAQNAESNADFIHKMKIAAKEADETEYWLMLCNEIENYPSAESVLEKLDAVIRILNKIISSAKAKRKQPLIS